MIDVTYPEYEVLGQETEVGRGEACMAVRPQYLSCRKHGAHEDVIVKVYWIFGGSGTSRLYLEGFLSTLC